MIDCRSEEGITIGLIDAMISIARVLAPRLNNPKIHRVKPGRLLPEIEEALKDLATDGDIEEVFAWADCKLEPYQIWPT